MIFRSFGPTSSCWGQNRSILNLYFGHLTVFWVSELIFWVSELIPMYFGCLNLYFGSQNLYFGCLILCCWLRVSELIPWAAEDQAFSYDSWIWKYWRTKHSGMTCESGNTEGPNILVWPVNLEILKDWDLWTSGPFGPWAWSAWAPRPCGPGLLPC